MENSGERRAVVGERIVDVEGLEGAVVDDRCSRCEVLVAVRVETTSVGAHVLCEVLPPHEKEQSVCKRAPTIFDRHTLRWHLGSCYVRH